MAVRQLPCPTMLRLLFTYDPIVGVLRWRPRPAAFFRDGKTQSRERVAKRWNTKFAGKEAGCPEGRRYHSVKITTLNGLMAIKTHRIAFAITHGRWPTHEIDHINRDTRDNRLCNLREATRSQNQLNVACRARSGFRGVSYNRGCRKWAAKVRVGGRSLTIGVYHTAEEAARVVDAHAIRYQGEFAVLNFP